MTPTLRRGSIASLDSTWATFRLQKLKEHIRKVADSQENGRELLRIEALKQLQDTDPEMVERALTCLMAVGNKTDIAAVEELEAHDASNVQKAAKVCRFELKDREQ